MTDVLDAMLLSPTEDGMGQLDWRQREHLARLVEQVRWRLLAACSAAVTAAPDLRANHLPREVTVLVARAAE